ncbi:Methylamine utilization protein MauG [Chlamydiales bacterium STE3]|nr:Methylamine utilization protein MauG [Chlamydiales bacterium STE3]
MLYRIILFFTIAILALFLGYKMMHGKAEKLPASSEETIIPPLGLPPIPWPEDNPYTKDKAELGRLLYFDKRLSSDQTISCASCHNIQCGYSDGKTIAVGISDYLGTRNSPTIINTAYAKHLFWDGRASSLEEQSKGPIANPKEMSAIIDADEAHRQCVDRIRNSKGYRALFMKVFGTEDITLDDIAKAIATYERTLLSGNSPYDRYQAGDRSALTQEQVRGLELFNKVKCSHCHTGFNFGDDRFLNIGIGMDKPNPDTGRYEITKDDRDWGGFKVPTLREIEHTPPYMHDGSLQTLEEVIDYYDKGGIKNKNLHPLIKPLNLSPEDKQALVSFLKSLSGEGWKNFKEPTQFPE